MPAGAPEHQFEKFFYNARMGGWSQRWRDRNSRWHRYDGFENVPHFLDVLREVEDDPTRILFG